LRKEAHENSLSKQVQILRDIINAQDHLVKNQPDPTSSIIKSIPNDSSKLSQENNLKYIDISHANNNNNDTRNDNFNDINTPHQHKLLQCQLDQYQCLFKSLSSFEYSKETKFGMAKEYILKYKCKCQGVKNVDIKKPIQ